MPELNLKPKKIDLFSDDRAFELMTAAVDETALSKNNSNDKAFDWMLRLNQEEDLFSQPSSTGVQIDEEQFASQEYQRRLSRLSYEDVKAPEPPKTKYTIKGAPPFMYPSKVIDKEYEQALQLEQDWLDLQGQLHGTVSEDTRSAIQKRTDEFYESGPIGATAAAVADLLPGIPFVDIIDPPSELSGKGMQEARNILGSLGMLGGLYKTPQAVGRVATNIREPWSYGGSLEKIKSNLGIIPGGRRALYQSLKAKDPNFPIPESFLATGLKAVPDKVKDTYNVLRRGIKSIVKDEPLYHTGGFAQEAREFLYRKTFGLKPRRGKNIFVENADGTLSFNPKSKRGRSLAREILQPDFIDDIMGGKKLSPHSVMGGYTRKELGKGKVSYEDIWDFKMNPSDWSELFDIAKGSRGEAYWYTGFGQHAKAKVGEAALRSLVHMITKPPHIKGVVDPFYPSWMGKYKDWVSQ